MALWVIPMWMKYGSRTVVGIEKALFQMSINVWKVSGQAEMAAMTGVAAIAVGVEAWQIWQEADKADNTTERVLLT